MKFINIIVTFLVVIFVIGCDKPKEKSAGELYEEAQILLTDIEKSDPDKALEILNKAISLDPNLLKAYLSRADAYMSLGENEKAFQDFNTAIRLDPDSPDIYFKRGRIYSDLKENEKAFDNFNQAIRLKPNFADVYFERGKIYFAIGVYNKALEDFNTALNIDPNHTKAGLYLDEVRPLVAEAISYDKTSSRYGSVTPSKKKKAAPQTQEVSTPSQEDLQYIDNNDGTITDQYTGRIWQKENDDTTRTWAGSRQYCESLTLAGFDDWTLPSSNTLRELNVSGDSVHAISKVFKCKNWGYWTSDSSAKNPDKATVVMYDYLAEYDGYVGIVTLNKKSAWRYARCVRMK